MEQEEAYCLYRLRKLTCGDIYQMVDSWLNEGIYTDSLNNIFWSKLPDIADLGPLFEKAMKELGVQEATRLEAAHILTRKTLQRIVSGDAPPDKGASFLYWNIYHEILDEVPDNKYVGDNLGLQGVFSWLREIEDCSDGSMILCHTDLPRPEAEKKFNEHLIDEAHKWLARNST